MYAYFLMPWFVYGKFVFYSIYFTNKMKHQYIKRFLILLSIVISVDISSLRAQTAG